MKQYYVVVKVEINRDGIDYEERIFDIYNSKAEALEKAPLISELYRECEVRITHKNLNTVKGTPIFKNGKDISMSREIFSKQGMQLIIRPSMNQEGTIEMDVQVSVNWDNPSFKRTFYNDNRNEIMEWISNIINADLDCLKDELSDYHFDEETGCWCAPYKKRSILDYVNNGTQSTAV